MRDQKTLGFKPLSVQNWRDSDPLFATFYPWASSEDPGAAWVADVLNAELPAATPIEIVRMFEAALGPLVYAYHFYPLLAHGLTLLMRIPEAAATERCKQLSAPPGCSDFSRKIDWLASCGVLQPGQKEAWHLLREFRNEVSHASFQDIWPPGSVLQWRDRIAEAITWLGWV
jgi:hypothetical protein